MISDDIKQKIKDATDIVQLFSQVTQVIPSGNRFKCCCPFHQEKTPSMMIDPVAGRYHCFGCGRNGDVISFVMERERLSFMEALKYLGDKAGIVVEDDPQAAKRSKRSKQMKACCQEAASFYHTYLMTQSSETVSLAREYLKGRGMDSKVCQRWEIGYAPGQGELFAHLIMKGFTREIIEAVNLGFVKGPATTDRFFNRIIFPIHNERGEYIAFGGRILGDGQPKYLNTAETSIFQKKRTLFAFNRAKDSMLHQKNVYITEGYTDVIACHEAGFTNVVATLGTACTLEHLTMLQRFVPRITFVFDGDAAGIKAAERIVDFAHQSSAQLYCASLPQGLDPAECLDQQGVDGLRIALDAAVPLYQFVIDRKLNACSSHVPEQRQQAILEALHVLRYVLDLPLAQDYVEYISQRMGVEPRRVNALLRQVKPGVQAAPAINQHKEAADYQEYRGSTTPSSQTPALQYTKDQRKRIVAEQRLLTLLVNYPHLIVKEKERLISLEWTHDITQAVALLMLEMTDEPTLEDMRALLAHVGERAQLMVSQVDLGSAHASEELAYQEVLTLIGVIRYDMLSCLIDRCKLTLKTGGADLSFINRPNLLALGDPLAIITELQKERAKLRDWLRTRENSFEG